MQIPGPLSSLAESHTLSVGLRCVLWGAWMILIHTHAGNCCSNSASMLSPDFKRWVWQYLTSWEQSGAPHPPRVSSKTPRPGIYSPLWAGHCLQQPLPSPVSLEPWVSTPSYSCEVLGTVFSPLLFLGLMNLCWSLDGQSKGLFFFESIWLTPLYIVAESHGTQTDLDFDTYWLCDLGKVLNFSGSQFYHVENGDKSSVPWDCDIQTETIAL